jgi:D-3-phosphoglycerate dehydrogenase
MRIVLCFPVEDRHVAAIRAAAPAGAEIVDAGQQRIAEELPTADVFIGHAKVPVDWDRVLRGGKLRWIQSSAAGLDHCLVPGVIADDRIVVTSASGLFAPQVTEQTLALLLPLIRSLPVFIAAASRREFIRRPTDDLRSKRVGIVGFGGNGKAIARALAPLCKRILATDYFASTDAAGVEQVWPHTRLSEMLRQSDVVILTLPLNEATRGLIDAERLAEMPAGSYLINVARGPIVVEADLVSALRSGHLRGAGLDVTEVEPLPAESPLWELSNVLITPHVGAQSQRRVDDTVALVSENLKRFQRGLPLYNRVDKRLGFPPPDVLWEANR